MIKKLLTLAIILLHIQGQAADILSGGFCYDIIAPGEVAVVPALEGIENTYEGTVIIPETVYHDGLTYHVTAIAHEAFAGSRVTQVQIPNTVMTIGDRAFAGCELLQSITLPLYVQHLGRAMLAATAIKSIVIPEGVEVLSPDTFYECVKLHTVYLPSTLLTIADGAFEDCFNLFEIYSAAQVPPVVEGDANFLAVSGVDVVVENNKVAAAYAADSIWGNTDTFSLWANDDINLDRPTLDIEREAGGRSRVTLGENAAFSIYGPDGYLLAVTAADNYYLPTPPVDTEYAIAATNLIRESEDMLPCTLTPEVTTAVEEVPEWARRPEIVAHAGAIHISGDRNGTWTMVCDIYGHIYYRHPTLECFIDNLPQGQVYVVVVGDVVEKVAL